MTDGFRPRGIVAAAVLAIAALALAWLCVRTALVTTTPDQAAVAAPIAPHDPDAVLAAATDAIVRQRGILDPAQLAAVRRAATAAPLDARPYLILGHQQLLDRRPDRALATFQAGQRLDPRQSLLHVLLLDRYLRTRRYAEAAAQMSVLARLVGGAQAPIATVLAAMALAPDTRAAAERSLATDPVLERNVLTALARADVPPAAIFALASPAARAGAGDAGSWGPVLVQRLVERRQPVAARAVWGRLYGVGDAGPAIFNAGFRSLPASPPFNWTLVAGSIGAADLRGGGLAIDYYGRDSGDLASQLLVLAPGRYRFSVGVDPGKTDNAARLIWSLGCRAGDTALMNLVVVAAPQPRRLAADVTVPAGCPAQFLTLRGEAGEFPAPTSVTVRAPDIRPLTSGGAAS